MDDLYEEMLGVLVFAVCCVLAAVIIRSTFTEGGAVQELVNRYIQSVIGG